MSIVLVAVLAFLGSASIGFLKGIPAPQAHDEFSYLLAADTFASGRITNPTHPMWIHFDTIHVIQQPTYMSRYMPAQGLFLALGRLVTGYPIAGVWLGMALMCGAICWMLHAWLPGRWALLGGLFAIIHPNIGIGNYWAQSYWGGAVAAGGGALLLGGVRYLIRKPRAAYAVTTGAGLAILANSRPYEGLVLSIPVGVGLWIWLAGKNGPPFAVSARRVLLPIGIVGVITIGAMGYYNYRVAGSVLRIPYLVYQQSRSVSALFIWQELPPKPTYHHKIIEDFHANYELPTYIEKHSFEGFIKVNYASLMMYGLVIGSVFAIPLIGSFRPLLSWSWNNRWGRFALFIQVFFILGLMLETYLSPHYFAPIIALNYYFIIQGIRIWRVRNYRVGQLVLYAVPLLALTVLAIVVYQSIQAYDAFAPSVQRARLLGRLKQEPGVHLVLLKYGPHHSFHAEWVYNDADIDGSKVIWARDMGPKKNCELVNYFKDRVIWLLEIDRDEDPVMLRPYPKQSCLVANP